MFTGPVNVLFDLVLHVPTMSAGYVPPVACAAVRERRPARPVAREERMIVSSSGSGLRYVRFLERRRFVLWRECGGVAAVNREGWRGMAMW